jgi:hypothetical protein
VPETAGVLVALGLSSITRNKRRYCTLSFKKIKKAQQRARMPPPVLLWP